MSSSSTISFRPVKFDDEVVELDDVDFVFSSFVFLSVPMSANSKISFRPIEFSDGEAELDDVDFAFSAFAFLLVGSVDFENVSE